MTTFVGSLSSYGSADGKGAAASFNNPNGVVVDGSGNLFVTDSSNHTIRKISPAGDVTTLAGRPEAAGHEDGLGSVARFNDPSGVAMEKSGNLFVADSANDTIRKITPGGMVTTLAGAPGSWGSADGTGSAARFSDPHGLAVDRAGNVFVADSGNHTIRKVTPAGVVTTLVGSAGLAGSEDGTGSAARFNSPRGLAVDGMGNLFVADSGNYIIRKITPDGVVTTPAGKAGISGRWDGTGPDATFGTLTGIAVDSAGNAYVADNTNNAIRRIRPEGYVNTVVGKSSPTAVGNFPGPVLEASLTHPVGLAIDPATGHLAITLSDAVMRVSW